MNSDLTPQQNATSTTNPQGIQDAIPLASDASQFQSSAGADALSQSHALQVTSTGQPIIGTTNKNLNVTGIVFVIVSTLVLVVLAVAVFKWVIKRPTVEPIEVESEVKPVPKVKVEAKPKKAGASKSKKSVKKSKAKKKSSGSKRKK